jgi:hypothetical protein
MRRVSAVLVLVAVSVLLLPTKTFGQAFGDRIYYVGSNQHIWVDYASCTVSGVYCVTSTVKYNDIDLNLLESGAPLPATNSAVGTWDFYNTDPQALYTLYFGANGHLETMYEQASPQSGSWSFEDLSSLAGAPAAASGSSLATLIHSGTPHAYYIGADSHVHEIYSPTASHWLPVDMTTAAGAPVPAVGSALAAWVGGSYELVYYTTASGHVLELYSRDQGATWSYTDVTTAASAPIAVGGSTLVGYEDGNTAHLYYFTSAGHVQELRTSGTAWVTFDLTTLSSAPLPANTSSLAGYTGGGWDFVYYLAPSGQVQELFASSNGNTWGTTDITNAAGAPVAGTNTHLIGMADGYISAFQVYYTDSGNFVRLLYVSSNQWLYLPTNTIPTSGASGLAFLEATGTPVGP